MSYRIVERQVPADGWRLGRDSLSKMVIYMSEDSPRTIRYSFDWKGPKSKKALSQEKGLERLERYLFKEFPAFQTAIFYDKASDRELYRINAKRQRIYPSN